MQFHMASTAKRRHGGLRAVSGVAHAKCMANPTESLHPKVRDHVKPFLDVMNHDSA